MSNPPPTYETIVEQIAPPIQISDSSIRDGAWTLVRQFSVALPFDIYQGNDYPIWSIIGCILVLLECLVSASRKIYTKNRDEIAVGICIIMEMISQAVRILLFAAGTISLLCITPWELLLAILIMICAALILFCRR